MLLFIYHPDVQYCQFDVSPVYDSDSDQMGHFMLDTKFKCKVENVNPFLLKRTFRERLDTTELGWGG